MRSVARLVAAALLLGLVHSARAGDDEAFVDLLRSTCRITHDGHSGTGFFVRRDPALYLVTAAHVFEESPSPDCRLVVRERKPDGTIARHELPLTVRRDGQPLWKRHATDDVAALPVTLPPEIDAAPLDFAHILRASASGACPVRLGQDVWLPGHPAQLEANAAGWPVLRRGIIASHPLSPVATVPTYIADIRSFGGDSGAPLYTLVNGSPRLAGVVVGMHRQTDRTTSPFEERTQHTPLGLAIVVQSELAASVIEQWKP